MPTQFTLEYALFVFIGALGALQFVFAVNGMRGALFISRSLPASALLGALLVLGAFIWFFASAPRNIPDTGLGLDGNDQSRWFTVAGATALALTLLVTSALNDRWGRTYTGGSRGLDALQQTTFLRAVVHTLSRLWNRS